MSRSRANGEGSIYQRKSDGLWVGAISLAEGKRKTYYGKTRREVQQKLTAALRDQQQGLPILGERQTLRHFLKRWLEETAKPSVRPSTLDSYSDLVRLHLIPELGRIPLVRLTPQDVQGMMGRKLAGGLSPRRVQYIRAVLRRALGQALKWGLVSRNVATLVDPPRVRYAEVRPFTPEQARQLLEAASGDRLEGLYTLCLMTGLRQGEALGLRWEDIDLEAGTLRVTKALQRVDGVLQPVEAKTPRSRRTIKLPRAAVAALHRHKVRQLEERLLAGSRWTDSGLIFTTTIGTPLDGSSVTHRFQKMLARSGLPRQRFHDLRHACASLLLAQGESARMIMELLGHSQISLTMNTYSHIMPSMQQQTADRMDAILSTPSGPRAESQPAE